MTDDARDTIPRWITTRVTAYRNTCPVPEGYVFEGSPDR